MADISKCVGKDCPLKDTCYRHTAPESCHQSYFLGTPGELVDDGFKCEYYWENLKSITIEQHKSITKQQEQ